MKTLLHIAVGFYLTNALYSICEGHFAMTAVWIIIGIYDFAVARLL